MVANTSDEPTGPEFSPDGKTLFLNLQRSGTGGVTLAIKGSFPRSAEATSMMLDDNRPPGSVRSEEATYLESLALPLTMPLTGAAALVSMRRRGAIDEVDPLLEEVADAMGEPEPIEDPKRRIPKTLD
jgi:hypothetical protein